MTPFSHFNLLLVTGFLLALLSGCTPDVSVEISNQTNTTIYVRDLNGLGEFNGKIAAGKTEIISTSARAPKTVKIKWWFEGPNNHLPAIVDSEIDTTSVRADGYSKLVLTLTPKEIWKVDKK